MGVPTKLAKAKQMAVYWDNYVNYLSTLDDKQPKVGQGSPKPPQTVLYIKPFAIDLDTDQYLKANGTSERWTTFGSAFNNYTKPTLNTGSGEIDIAIRRVRPAKVVIKTGMSITKSVKTANTTKRKYVTYGGVSGSIPFGKYSTDTEVEAYQTIAAAVKAVGGFNADTMRVSRVKEYA
jgi:hypothetical protein